MAWVAISCPQCSAPLPRIAIWKAVKCQACGSLITRTASVVKRDDFRQALVRARQNSAGFGGDLMCAGQSYRLMQKLSAGDGADVFLAQRQGPIPLIVTVILSSSSSAAARFTREAAALRELHESASENAAAYTVQRLPEVVAMGSVEDQSGRFALVLRHSNGYWGSLADLHSRFPQGIDPRHSVWIWRRMLDVLHYLHAQGWAHGSIRPDHALVHPKDHGVLLIGWDAASKGAGPQEWARDLLSSAKIIQILVGGKAGGEAAVAQRLPGALGELINRSARDERFCIEQGAAGLDQLLRAASRDAFGPPSFVPLIL